MVEPKKFRNPEKFFKMLRIYEILRNVSDTVTSGRNLLIPEGLRVPLSSLPSMVYPSTYCARIKTGRINIIQSRHENVDFPSDTVV